MKTADVSFKPRSYRTSRACGRIRVKRETIRRIKEGDVPKGNLIEATKLAGILGAKKTPEILPFCHPVEVDFLQVSVLLKDTAIEVESEVRGISRTGFEMEALTAVSSALLNIYDMCKGFDETMVIEEIRITEKSGGKSDWAKDLKGKTFNVLSPSGEIAEMVSDYLSSLGAQRSKDADLLIIVGEEFDQDIERRLTSLESVVSLYDFEGKPQFTGEGITIGIRKEGGAVVVLPADRDRVVRFFETFGPLLGDLLR